MKAKFFQRALAYLVDLFIISLIIAIINVLIPEPEIILTLKNKLEDVTKLFFENKIGLETYINRYSAIYYQLDYKLVLYNIIQFVVLISYFAIYQYYNNGKTIGKKMCRIKIVNINKEPLSMNALAIRTLIIYGLFGVMINLLSILIFSSKIYYFISTINGFFQFLIVIVTIFMILYKKDGRGIHDLITKTEVVIDEDRR